MLILAQMFAQRIFKTFLVSVVLIFSKYSFAARESQLKYWTSFGQCPSKSAGSFVLKLTNTFEANKSLLSLKKTIVENDLMDKYYLSDYKIDYNPVRKRLEFRLDCPGPLVKVHVYNNSGNESYEALLVTSGRLFDPTYEVLLRSEKKLDYQLPILSIQEDMLSDKINNRLVSIFNPLDLKMRKKISEIILDEHKEMTVIMSLKGRPSSVFLGKDNWEIKVEKLQKIISFMEKKKKIPAIINITNLKKVVVKFNDNL